MNALTEFLNQTANKEIIAVEIHIGSNYDEPECVIKADLPLNYTYEQYEDFKKSINVEYYDGYGGQNLFGTIWYKDGTWSSRGEYDGSEWWMYNKCPDIPESLRQ